MPLLRTEGSYNIDDLVQMVNHLAKPQALKRIAGGMVLHVSTYMSDGAESRHKWANKLGAEPTGMLEFTPSRDVSLSKAGGKIVGDVQGNAATVTFVGVMGISRAFKDLDIYPRNASALTVPVHRVSYAKTVGDLESAGWHIFRRGRMLVGNHGSTTAGRAVPLFVLCGHVHINRDPELLPSSALLYQWAINEAVDELRHAGW